MNGEIISYHLVGRFFDSDAVWIATLNANLVPETLDEATVEVLKHLCTRAGAIPVCTIRGRYDLDGNTEWFHGYFGTPSPEDNLARVNALVRIQNDFDERAVQRMCEDVKVLEELK